MAKVKRALPAKPRQEEPEESALPIHYLVIGGVAVSGLLFLGTFIGYFAMNRRSVEPTPIATAPEMLQPFVASVTESPPSALTVKPDPVVNAPKEKPPATQIVLEKKVEPAEEGRVVVAPKAEPRVEVKPFEPLDVAKPEMPAEMKKPEEMPKAEMPKKQQGLDEKQIAINLAIEKGVRYLKTNSADHPGHGTGIAAIAGLALMECGTPVNDPQIQMAAKKIRADAVKLTHTYQVSLAILFLDRLGEPADRPIIQCLAMRLLAGQTGNGGWNYQCPILPPSDMVQLYKFLESNLPPNLKKMQETRRELMAPLAQTSPNAKSNLNDPFRKYEEMLLTSAIVSPNMTTKPAPKTSLPALISEVEEKSAEPSKTTPKKTAPLVAKKPSDKNPQKAQALPQHLRGLPVVMLQNQAVGQIKLNPNMDDNSNTQFALLALWVARRHDVPTEQALLLAEERFRKSQMPDGHWEYRLTNLLPGPPKNGSMTSVGLLGLALGQGARTELSEARPPQSILNDPAVQSGLQNLSQFIGSNDLTLPGLYFLWSVERIGVLYDLKLIHGKDWYGWGSQLLVNSQLPDGSWMLGHYPGSTPYLDTCLALLFLKRANLTRDLTENLRLSNPIREPYPATSSK